MGSLDHIDLIGGVPLLQISTFPSLAVIGLGKVEIYLFLFVTWVLVATWLQGYVTLMVVVPHLKSLFYQVWLAISPVKMEIWSILIFNVRRRIHVIILLQSVTIQFRKLFWYILFYKVRQSKFITKCGRYYKVWQTLL